MIFLYLPGGLVSLAGVQCGLTGDSILSNAVLFKVIIFVFFVDYLNRIVSAFWTFTLIKFNTGIATNAVNRFVIITTFA